jgi:DNA-binding SARP family transcriptional activator/tetratricopeptide (TPR) repeat protein
MRFRILGPLEVLSPDGWTAISAAKWRSLLACLLVRPGQLVPTENLIFELWGDAPPSTANNLVSIYVHQLKKVIGDTERRVLVYRAPGYMLRVAPGDLDIQQFESLAAEGRGALAACDPERAAAQLGEALRLWRGPLLADVPPTPLLETHARRVAELWFTTTELRVEADLACGRAIQVIPELHGLVTEHPLRERLWALLMQALDEAGRRAEALETYAQARKVIADELGVDPGSELQRLYAELFAADASPSSSAPPTARPRRARVVPDAADALVALGTAAAARPDARADAASGPGDADTGEPSPEPAGSIAIGTFVGSAEAEAEAEAGPGVLEEAAESSSRLPRPAQLPADIGDFTGRETHVDQLCTLLLAGNAARSPGAVRIVVVNGAAGLGKTTLAVHAAHQVSVEFPDGQLYVDLQGASFQTASPGEVLARFLRDLGIEGDKIPVRDDERAALYRTTLAGRRMLILLDNAKDAAQVRPLLPGSSSCAVLVTTRNRTADLASMRFVDLNVLEDTEALALFSRIVGEERAAAEPDATAEVLVACAGLPLAIRICAARLAARRQWKIATLADRLRNQHRRLDELKTGDLAVRASFQVSYGSLRAPAGGVDPARVFRLLGLWEGSWISRLAAAALVGAGEDDIADALEMLVDVNLLESPAPDWYRFHDLLRVYATERAEAEDPEAVRAEAVGRLLAWYLGTAEAAADTISPRRYQVAREPALPGCPLMAFADTGEALAWYDGERANVVTATRQAAAASMHEIAWRLPTTLYSLFNRRSNWADCVTTQRIAAESVRRAGDRLGEAWVLNQLGFALAKMGDRESFGHLEQALAIRRELGDTAGEAQTALALGEGHLNIDGPGQDALRYMQHAVALRRPLGLSYQLGVSVNNLGDAYFGLGDLDAAAACFVEAREIFRELGGYGEGHALHNLGRVFLRQNRLDDAVTSCTEAVREHRAAGDLRGEAIAFKHLGEAYELTGNTEEARAAWTTALTIFEQVGDHAQAAEVAAALVTGVHPQDDASPLCPTFLSTSEHARSGQAMPLLDSRTRGFAPNIPGCRIGPVLGLRAGTGERTGKMSEATPESTITDEAAVPQSTITDEAAVPQSTITDEAAVPQSTITDEAAAVPQSTITDEDESDGDTDAE